MYGMPIKINVLGKQEKIWGSQISDYANPVKVPPIIIPRRDFISRNLNRVLRFFFGEFVNFKIRQNFRYQNRISLNFGEKMKKGIFFVCVFRVIRQNKLKFRVL